MNKYLPALGASALFFGAAVLAQEPSATKSNAANAPAVAHAPTITANSTPMDLARAALAAQGGDKFKNLKSMMLTGTCICVGRVLMHVTMIESCME